MCYSILTIKSFKNKINSTERRVYKIKDKKSLYFCLPNKLIKYSCRINHYILPVYMYSAINQSVYNNNYVDTNLSHIIETFTTNVDNRKQIYKEYQKAIKILLSDVEDIKIENDIQPSEYHTIYGFDACLVNFKNITSNSNEIDSISKTDRLTYRFLDSGNVINGWTPFTFDEYYYLINYKDYSDNFNGKFDVNEINLINIMNFYSYLKMRILVNENISNAKLNGFISGFHVANSFMSEVMSVGKNTVTKYFHQLEFMGLIKLHCSKDKTMQIELNEKWKEYFEN